MNLPKYKLCYTLSYARLVILGLVWVDSGTRWNQQGSKECDVKHTSVIK
jgi:hypothetical protein